MEKKELNMPKIYFVFPVYNEQANIQVLVNDIRTHMKGQPYKIIAVNDGSTDSSLEILQGLEQEDIEITGSSINMNVGAVFNAGIARVLEAATDNDILVIMESDRTSDIKAIDEMIENIRQQGQDIVIASRYQRGGAYKKFPIFRRIFSLGASSLMRYFFPIKNVYDYTIFFRAYRVGIIRRAVRYFGAFGLIQSKGFVANAEILIKLSFFTTKIMEIPFIYDYGQKKGKSKIRLISTINEYFVLVNYMRRVSNKIQQFKKRNQLQGVLS
jgi:dolichol-phosphate mannosyltransferase